MLLNMIVAFDYQRGIGKNNQLPWHYPEDLKHFSKLTKGNGNNAIIMGKNTFKSIGKSLPWRENLILSKSLVFNNKQKKTYTFKSIKDCLDYCENKKFDEVWIIGGSSIYKQFIDNYKIHEIYITQIKKTFDCDTFFPPLKGNYSIITLNDYYDFSLLKYVFLS